MTTFTFTANEERAARILTSECLSGMGGKRPIDLREDEYTWCDAATLVKYGWSKEAAAGTFSSLMDKGFIFEADTDAMAVTTAAYEFMETIWDKPAPKAEALDVAKPKKVGVKKDEATGAKTFANKASARRAAKRDLGDDKFNLEENTEGRWFFVDATPKPAPKAKAKSKKPTAGSKPLDVVWGFFEANPKMARGDVVKALTDKGINVHTVKTQFQKFFKHGSRDAALKFEREQRAAK